MSLYTAPSTLDMIAKARRALRDTAGDVFEVDLVTDFINAGLAELSAIRPLETTVSITSVDGLDGIDADPDAVTVADLDYIYMVEVVGLDGTSQEGSAQTVSPEDNSTNWRNGWDFVGGRIVLPPTMRSYLESDWEQTVPTMAVLARGYRHRRRIDDPNTDVLDIFSLPEEQAVTFMAQKAGFESLLNDRALFQQWQTATNNTDVSPNQLSGMVQGALINWERMRKHLYVIRRSPVGAQ
jgi:hypothetical protein